MEQARSSRTSTTAGPHPDEVESLGPSRSGGRLEARNTVGAVEPRQRVRFKVCCVASPEELHAATEAGASAVGLVSSMPSGPGVIPDAQIADIARQVPPGVDSFLLTSLQDPEAIIEQHRQARTSTLQLVDELPAGAHARLRAALPGIRLVQVVHVVDQGAIDQAATAAQFVDAVLVDSGNPTLEVKQLGGTGRRHDWAVSARIRKQLNVPIFLAGGLNADNVAEAIDTVQPFALDVCTGVRDEALALDLDKLARFATAVASTATR
jgi:phosphoribosylanthranilate isomerase